LATDAGGTPGRFAALRHRRYRYRCIATLLANIGHWSQLSAVAWYVLEAADNHGLSGLVQSAAMAPVLLFTLFAGSLVDRHDGEAVQRWAQGGVLVCGGLMAWVAWRKAEPIWLLVVLFVHGVGLAIRAPAWQASLPALVHRTELPGAVLLNASAFNLARIAGAAMGGMLLPAVGLPVLCVINMVLAGTLLTVLLADRLPPARQASAGGTVRQAIMHPLARRIAWRSLMLGVPASAILALLPAHVSGALAGDASAYGGALAWFGAGAVVGGLCITRTRADGVDHGLAVRTILLAVGMAGLAAARDTYSAAAWLLLAGGAWTRLFALINTTLQLGVPDNIRGSALALYITCMFGGMTLGSAVWSLIAEHHGTPRTMALASLLLAGCTVQGWLWPLRGNRPP
jgi:MFS family permease